MLTKRESQLIELLLEEENFQPASFFSEKLNVSNKTIYQDIQKLGQFLNRFELKIEKKPRIGIYLIGTSTKKNDAKIFITSKEAMSTEVKYSSNYRRVYLFANLIFKTDKKRYEYFEKKFFVSIATLRKDYEEIIKYCRLAGIRITSNHVIDTQKTPEELIQRTFVNYFEKNIGVGNEKCQYHFVFDQAMVQFVDDFVKNFYQQSKQQPTNYIVHSLKLSLLTLIGRVKHGYHSQTNKNPLFVEIKKMELYMVALDFSNGVKDELNCSFTINDLYFICSLFMGHGVRPFVNLATHSQQIMETTKQFIQDMSTLVEKDLGQDSQLLQSLFAHIEPMVYRLQMGITIKNPLKEDIIRQYSTMYTLTTYCIPKLEKAMGIRVTDDEITFLTIHFQLAFEKIVNTKHVFLICPTGLGTSQLLFQRIRHSSPSTVVYEVIDVQKLQDYNLDSVDLIISTVKLENEYQTPIIYVRPLPTKEEIALINRHLLTLNQQDNTFLPSIAPDKTILKKYLKDGWMFLNQDFDSRESVLSFITEKYKEEQLVKDNFLEVVLQREKLGATGLSSGVAIPHANPKYVVETKISIITLKNKITWGDVDVRVVLFLAIAEEDMIQVKNMIALLYEVFVSPERIKSIASKETRNEIINEIIGKRK